MTVELQALAELLAPWLWAGALVALRIGAAVFLLPGFSAQAVPMRIRLALTVALALIVAPAVAVPQPFVDADFGAFAAALVSETVTGLCLGFVVRLTIWILQILGTIAAQSTSLSQILGAAAVDPQPAIAQVFAVAGLALAMMAGFHTRIAAALIESYTLVPLGTLPLASGMTGWAVDEVTSAFALAFSLAAPFAIASLLYNMALGAINRAMPQLMVAFVGAPAITAGGLALLALAAPLILTLWLDRLDRALAFPFGAP
ncbi:MAG: flagellar biosynthetic protein FliR [Rhodobacteraceae bacterium]|nr:flagellar biosynthetic protein FliR [Paracoccaceae bacterium]